MQRVLVTGGAGFIGATLCQSLQKEGIEPVVIDNLSAGVCYIPDSVKRYSLACSQLADAPEIFDNVDGVVHLAGKPSVQFANENPLEALEGNLTDTLRITMAAAKAGVRRLVFASSNAAVGTVQGAIHEDVLPAPISFYGASKLGAEAYCLASASYLGMEAVILRFANVYGPMSLHKPSVIHKFIGAALADRPVAVYGDGSQTRDFIFVEDVCRGIIQSLRRPYTSPRFQIGSGTSTSVLQIIEALEEVLDRPVQRKFEEARPGDVKHSVSDIAQAKELLGWEPLVGLREGLARTVEYYRAVQ